jgi:beta-lactamase regulating signal transducer with metallopeptidase domain
MSPLIEMISNYVPNSNFTAAFLDASIKSFAILALAGGVCLCWRHPSAATRHLIWFLAVACLPCLPLISSMLPSWKRPLWSVSTSLNSGNQFLLTLELARGAQSGFSGQQTPTSAPETATSAVGGAQSGRAQRIATQFNGGWLVLALGAWAGGILLVLSSVAVARLRLHRISRRAQASGGAEWTVLLQELGEGLNMRRSVILLQSLDNVMPATWGWWRPVILLPAEAGQWSAERQRIVLLHELAHVKRWDCLTQMITRIVCAFYWFNPLVWVAARRMCIERESACDDLGLNGGCKASDYASHLVELAGKFRRVPRAVAIAMARPSGLERRITAILDGRRNRDRIAKVASVCIALVLLGLEFLIGANAVKSFPEAWSLERSDVANQLKRFVAEKEAQAIAGAKAEGKEMLPEFKSLFVAAGKGDWMSISNIWENLRARAPQYEGSGPKDMQLHGTAWSTVLETWGAFGNIVMGGENLVTFGKDAVESIPSGSVYFGGTDPGRCVITALQKSHVNGDPFFTLTQNALADGSYLQYLRAMYGGKIYIPTDEDANECFNEYTADAQRRLKEKKLKPGEDVKEVDGKVHVSGQVAVMAINALLAKIIFDKNSDREFYLEESFPLDWMYPHLSPNGPIMKINRQPLSELSEEIVRRDHAYWTRALQPMIGDWLNYDTPVQKVIAFAARARPPKQDQYVRNDAAPKWASKLRSSIAGVYAWRAEHAANETEKAAMAREADFALRQAVAVCPYSPDAVFRYTSSLSAQKRISDAILVAETAAALTPDNVQFLEWLKQLKETEKAK